MPNQQLQRLRLLAGLSSNRLGRAAMIAGKTIREAERGDTTPHPLTQQRIARALTQALGPDVCRQWYGRPYIETLDIWPLDVQRVAA